MPSRGINFATPKQRRDDYSQHSRTAATREWERGLTGLSLALHRADKAASVARSRAIATVKKAPGWASLSSDEQQDRIQKAIERVNTKRELKRKEAEEQWMHMHADSQQSIGSLEVDVIGSDGKKRAIEDKVMEEEGEDEEMDAGENEKDYLRDDDENEEWCDDISEAEEGEDSSDEALTEESRTSLHENLLLLRERQREEHQAFIQQIEQIGKACEGTEMPDDYVFGNS
jgi:hypothetical protein